MASSLYLEWHQAATDHTHCINLHPSELHVRVNFLRNLVDNLNRCRRCVSLLPGQALPSLLNQQQFGMIEEDVLESCPYDICSTTFSTCLVRLPKAMLKDLDLENAVMSMQSCMAAMLMLAVDTCTCWSIRRGDARFRLQAAIFPTDC